MSGVHSILAPSGAAIWEQCSAAPRMQLPYANDPPTPESMEGDAAHWLAANIAAHHVGAFVGDTAPNGVKIDQDMIDGAELFRDVVGPGATHEKSVVIGGIHPHCFGTPDARRAELRKLKVYDYKYGHRFVEVFNLWQLVSYALGVIETEHGGIRPDEIEFIVVQPRSYSPEGPVRSWTYGPKEFNDLVAHLHKRAHAAVSLSGVPHPNAPATTGPECGDCRARHECTAFQQVAARIVDAENVRTERFNLPPAQLGAELSYLDEAIDRLKARRDGLAIQGEDHVRNGRAVQGYGMENGKSIERWRETATVDEVALVGNVFGVELRAEAKLLTPTQARAEIKRRALPPELLDAYAVRPSGAMKFTRNSTIRARKAFGANKQ